MGSDLRSIRIVRLVLALTVIFLIADTYPHPKLHPGLIESTFTRYIKW